MNKIIPKDPANFSPEQSPLSEEALMLSAVADTVGPMAINALRNVSVAEDVAVLENARAALRVASTLIDTYLEQATDVVSSVGKERTTDEETIGVIVRRHIAETIGNEYFTATDIVLHLREIGCVLPEDSKKLDKYIEQLIQSAWEGQKKVLRITHQPSVVLLKDRDSRTDERRYIFAPVVSQSPGAAATRLAAKRPEILARATFTAPKKTTVKPTEAKAEPVAHGKNHIATQDPSEPAGPKELDVVEIRQVLSEAIDVGGDGTKIRASRARKALIEAGIAGDEQAAKQILKQAAYPIREGGLHFTLTQPKNTSPVKRTPEIAKKQIEISFDIARDILASAYMKMGSKVSQYKEPSEVAAAMRKKYPKKYTADTLLDSTVTAHLRYLNDQGILHTEERRQGQRRKESSVKNNVFKAGWPVVRKSPKGTRVATMSKRQQLEFANEQGVLNEVLLDMLDLGMKKYKITGATIGE